MPSIEFKFKTLSIVKSKNAVKNEFTNSYAIKCLTFQSNYYKFNNLELKFNESFIYDFHDEYLDDKSERNDKKTKKINKNPKNISFRLLEKLQNGEVNEIIKELLPTSDLLKMAERGGVLKLGMMTDRMILNVHVHNIKPNFESETTEEIIPNSQEKVNNNLETKDITQHQLISKELHKQMQSLDVNSKKSQENNFKQLYDRPSYFLEEVNEMKLNLNNLDEENNINNPNIQKFNDISQQLISKRLNVENVLEGEIVEQKLEKIKKILSPIKSTRLNNQQNNHNEITMNLEEIESLSSLDYDNRENISDTLLKQVNELHRFSRISPRNQTSLSPNLLNHISPKKFSSDIENSSRSLDYLNNLKNNVNKETLLNLNNSHEDHSFQNINSSKDLIQLHQNQQNENESVQNLLLKNLSQEKKIEQLKKLIDKQADEYEMLIFELKEQIGIQKSKRIQSLQEELKIKNKEISKLKRKQEKLESSEISSKLNKSLKTIQEFETEIQLLKDEILIQSNKCKSLELESNTFRDKLEIEKNQHKEEIYKLNEKIHELKLEQETNTSLTFQLKEMKKINLDQINIIKEKDDRLLQLAQTNEKTLFALKTLKMRSEKSELFCKEYSAEKLEYLNEINSLKDTISLLNQEINTSNENSNLLKEDNERLIEINNQIKKENDLLEKKFKLTEEQVENLTSKNLYSVNLLNSLREEISEKSQKLLTAKSRILGLQKEKQLYFENYNKIETKLNIIREELKSKDIIIENQNQESYLLKRKIEEQNIESSKIIDQKEKKFEMLRLKCQEIELAHSQSKELILTELQKTQQEYINSVVETEKLEAENNILKSKWEDADSSKMIESYLLKIQNNYTSMLEDQRRSFDSEKQSYKNLELELKNNINILKNSEIELRQELENKNQELNELKQLSMVLKKERNEILDSNSELKLNQIKNLHLEETCKEFQEKLEDHIEKIKELQEKLEISESERKPLQYSLREALGKSSVKDQQIESLNDIISQLKEQIEILKSKTLLEDKNLKDIFNSEKDLLVKKIEKLDIKLKKIQKENQNHLESKLNLESQLQKQRQFYEQKIDQLRKENNSKDIEISQIAENLFLEEENLQSQVRSLSNKVTESENQINKYKLKVKDLKKDKISIKNQKLELLQSLNELKISTYGEELESSISKKQLEEKEVTIIDLRNKIDLLSKELVLNNENYTNNKKQLINKNSQLSLEVEELRSSINVLNLKLNEQISLNSLAQENVERLNIEIKQLQQKYSHFDKETQENDNKIDKLIEELNLNLKKKNIEIESQRKKYKKLEDSLKNASIENYKLKKALDESVSENEANNHQIESLKRISSNEKTISNRTIKKLSESNISLQREVMNLYYKFQSISNENVLNSIENEDLKEAIQIADIRFASLLKKFQIQDNQFKDELQRENLELSKFLNQNSNLLNKKENKSLDSNDYPSEDAESVQGELLEASSEEGIDSKSITERNQINKPNNIKYDSLVSPKDLPSSENVSMRYNDNLYIPDNIISKKIEEDSMLSSSFEEQEELLRAHETLELEHESIQKLYENISQSLEELRLEEKQVLIDLNLIQSQLQASERQIARFSRELDRAITERNEITSSFSSIAAEREEYEKELSNILEGKEEKLLSKKDSESVRRLKFRLKKAEGLEEHKNSVLERLKIVEENASAEIEKFEINRSEAKLKLKEILEHLKNLETRKETLQKEIKKSVDKCNTTKVKFEVMKAQIRRQPESSIEDLQHIFTSIAKFEEDIKYHLKFIPEMEALNHQSKEIEDILKIIGID